MAWLKPAIWLGILLAAVAAVGAVLRGAQLSGERKALQKIHEAEQRGQQRMRNAAETYDSGAADPALERLRNHRF